MWFGLATDSSLPFLLQANRTTSGHDYALVMDGWTSVGAQVHPAPNLVLPAPVLAAFLDANRVVYVAGPPGDRIYLVQVIGS